MRKLNILCDKEGNVLDVNKEMSNESLLLKKNKIFSFFHPNYVTRVIKVFVRFSSSDNDLCKINDVLVEVNGIFYRTSLILKKAFKSSNIEIQFSGMFPEEKEKYIFKFRDFFFLTRFKFILGSVLPFSFGFFWSLYAYESIAYNLLGLTLISLILMHVSANTFNDYFDWVSGTDKINKDYVMFNTGGSRAIDFNIVSDKWMFNVSWVFTVCVFLLGLYFIYARGLMILLLGIIGFMSLYFYSAPPIHLASRYGMGELMHIFCLGPMITYGTVLMLTGSASKIDFALGLPFGILITCCLLVNEYPDSVSDKVSGKKNLAVLLSAKYIPIVYFLCSLIAVFVTLYFINVNLLPETCYIVLFIGYNYYTVIKNIFRLKTSDRSFLINMCTDSFKMYFNYVVLINLGLLLSFLTR